MLGRIFLKSDKTVATPWLLRIGVVLIGWSYLSGLVRHLELGHRAALHAAPLRWSTGVGVNVLGLALALALWNLKRWAAVGLVMLALVNVALFAGLATHLTWIAALRLIPLVPAGLYWKKLTWT